MTNKKIKNKIAKVLRKYFNMSFIGSQIVAKAIVDNFSYPKKALTEDEDRLMVRLFNLTFLTGCNPKIMRVINVAIYCRSLKVKKAESYETLYCNYMVAHEIVNLKNGHHLTINAEM